MRALGMYIAVTVMTGFMVGVIAHHAEGAVAATPPDQLANAGFEIDKFDGWKTFGTGWRLSAFANDTISDAHNGRIGVVNDVVPGDKAEFRGIYQEIVATAGAKYTASVWVRTFNVLDSQCYLEIQFLDAAGQVIQNAQSEPVTLDQPFSMMSVRDVEAPKGTQKISVRGVVQMTRAPDGVTTYFIFDDFEIAKQ